MGMGEKGVGIGFIFRVCVFIMLPTAKVIWCRGKDLASSNRLEKPGIEPAAPCLQGKLHPLHHSLKCPATNLSENGLKGTMLID